MKALDIALKDMLRSFRSFFAIIFMFVVPLLVTGMFYFMFGNIASSGEFNLPRTKVIIANLDEGGPKFQVNPKNIPDGKKADSMGDLIVNIMESDEMSDFIELSIDTDPELARATVDNQEAQVAIIIQVQKDCFQIRPISPRSSRISMVRRTSSFTRTQP